ncbi:MAG: phenylacetate--CoA ligase family protein [Deltaproteobacteria bacterium]|nr:phenylacetate--CoA ligase family protein [Deltaproteobacteria bacterium]
MKPNDFQPESLIAYANMSRQLAQEQIAGNLHISPQAVFCASEVLTKDSRKLIHKDWGVQPFNVHATTETAGIASEYTQHTGLHMYEDLVITEVVDEQSKPVKPGEYGAKLLVTVLFSRTLPLIRYEIDDSVRLSSYGCACGRPFALLDDIQGRMEEAIHLTNQPDGVITIQPNFFHNIMELFPVGGWQIIQESNNTLRVLIVDPSPDFNEVNLRRTISTELEKQWVNRPSVKVEYVASLDRTDLGKTFLIKSSIGNRNRTAI